MKKKLFCLIFLASSYILHPASCPTLWAGFLPEGAFGNKAKGTTAASFLKISPSPRAAALADTLGLSDCDPLAGLHMPAAYSAFPGRFNSSLASSLLPEGIVHAVGTFGFPIKRGKMAVTVNELVQPSLKLYDALGNNTGQFSPLDSAISLAFASQERGVYLGASLSYLQSKIGPSLSGQGVFSSLGIGLAHGYFDDPNLALGLAVANLGPPAQWGGRAVPLPLRGQAHLAYKLGALSFLSLDGFLPVDQAPYGAAAIEWKTSFSSKPPLGHDPIHGVAIRAGVTTKNKTDNFAGKLSFGAGLYIGRLTIDAGAAAFGNLGFFPRLGINLAF